MVALRGIPAILYVRARLRLERHKPVAHWPALLAHAVALATGFILVVNRVTPGVLVVALGGLLLRAIWGLSDYRKPTSRPAVIGMAEMLYGIAYVIILGLGYAL